MRHPQRHGSPSQPACAVALSVGATNPTGSRDSSRGRWRRSHGSRAGTVVGVALFYAIRRNEGDAKIAVHIGADDRLVVARNRPRERLLGIGGRGRRATPGKSALLAIHDVSRLDVAHARRISRGLRTGMMGIGAE